MSQSDFIQPVSSNRCDRVFAALRALSPLEGALDVCEHFACFLLYAVHPWKMRE
jgi:hypothetical protein